MTAASKSGLILAQVSQNPAKMQPTPTEIVQSRLNPNRFWTKFHEAEAGPKLAQLRPHLADVGQLWANPGHMCLLIELGPKHAKSDPILSCFHTLLAGFGRVIRPQPRRWQPTPPQPCLEAQRRLAPMPACGGAHLCLPSVKTLGRAAPSNKQSFQSGRRRHTQAPILATRTRKDNALLSASNPTSINEVLGGKAHEQLATHDRESRSAPPSGRSAAACQLPSRCQP